MVFNFIQLFFYPFSCQNASLIFPGQKAGHPLLFFRQGMAVSFLIMLRPLPDHLENENGCIFFLPLLSRKGLKKTVQ